MNKKLSFLALTIALLACSTTMEPFSTYPPDPTATPSETASLDEPDSGAVHWPATAETASPARCAIVTADTALHLRAAPDETSQVKDYLFHGDELELIEMRAKWWKVKTTDQTGWAKADYLQEAECG